MKVFILSILIVIMSSCINKIDKVGRLDDIQNESYSISDSTTYYTVSVEEDMRFINSESGIVEYKIFRPEAKVTDSIVLLIVMVIGIIIGCFIMTVAQ